jgi:hypothetical protein
VRLGCDAERGGVTIYRYENTLTGKQHWVWPWLWWVTASI